MHFGKPAAGYQPARGGYGAHRRVAVAVQAQTAATLSQVRKIYVEPFSGKLGAGEIRNEMIERLKRRWS